jgi:hypothetical protein
MNIRTRSFREARPVWGRAKRLDSSRTRRGILLALLFSVIGCGSIVAETTPAASSDANRLTYLDGSDPFYVGGKFPKLTTPQWIGDPGVQAAVILAVDDMNQPERWEKFLRPILERLKQNDGRAPVSIHDRFD